MLLSGRLKECLGEDEHHFQQLDVRPSEDQFRSPEPEIWRLVPCLRGSLNPPLSPPGTLGHPAWLGDLSQELSRENLQVSDSEPPALEMSHVESQTVQTAA